MGIEKTTQQGYLQFTFAPYIRLRDDLRVGNILLWPFYLKKDNYIPDPLVRRQMEKFLERFVGSSEPRRPLKNVTIVSYKSPSNLKPLTRKQSREVRDAITTLCFCTLIRNASHIAFSSDDFQIIQQNFLPTKDKITPSSGSLIRRTTAGLKIAGVLFITPFHICQGWDICYDQEILRGIEKLQRDRANREFHRQIITSLEWIGYAYTNVDNFNYASRIVMTATAFEILLGGFANRVKFMKKIKRLTCDSSDNCERNRSEREICYHGKKQKKSFSLKECWAYDFYDLRSRIVHGKEVRSKDFKNRRRKKYFFLGIRFFEQCLKRLLSEKNCYSYDDGNKILWARIYDDI
jgi:hypothetical protein